MLNSIKKISNPAFFKGVICSISRPDIKIFKFGKVPLLAWNVPMRSLPLWHLYWNSEDGSEFRLRNQILHLNRDQMILIPPHTFFGTEMNRPFEHLYIDFHVNVPYFDKIPPQPILFPAEPYLKLLNTRCEDYSLRVISLYALLFQVLLNLPESVFESADSDPMDDRVAKALNMIEECFPVVPDNSRLARKVGMSVSCFQRLFKQHTGIPPKQYILNLRLDTARNLLLNSKLSIDEIALSTGFSSRYHFSKIFSAVFKCPPRRFRRNYGILPIDIEAILDGRNKKVFDPKNSISEKYCK